MQLTRAKYTVIEKDSNFSICESGFLKKNPNLLMGNSKTLFVFFVEYDQELEFESILFKATEDVNQGYHSSEDKELYIKENNNRVF